MNGYNRIKDQYLELLNKDKPLIKIVRYLMMQPNMNELYLREEKCLEEMMKFINGKEKERIHNLTVKSKGGTCWCTCCYHSFVSQTKVNCVINCPNCKNSLLVIYVNINLYKKLKISVYKK